LRGIGGSTGTKIFLESGDNTIQICRVPEPFTSQVALIHRERAGPELLVAENVATLRLQLKKSDSFRKNIFLVEHPASPQNEMGYLRGSFFSAQRYDMSVEDLRSQVHRHDEALTEYISSISSEKNKKSFHILASSHGTGKLTHAQRLAKHLRKNKCIIIWGGYGTPKGVADDHNFVSVQGVSEDEYTEGVIREAKKAFSSKQCKHVVVILRLGTKERRRKVVEKSITSGDVTVHFWTSRTTREFVVLLGKIGDANQQVYPTPPSVLLDQFDQFEPVTREEARSLHARFHEHTYGMGPDIAWAHVVLTHKMSRNRLEDELLQNLITMRGHVVEAFVLREITSSLPSASLFSLRRGEYRTHHQHQICGTPDGIIMERRDPKAIPKAILEVKTTMKSNLDDLKLGWIFQVHVYMLLYDVRVAYIVLKEFSVHSPRPNVHWKLFKIRRDEMLINHIIATKGYSDRHSRISGFLTTNSASWAFTDLIQHKENAEDTLDNEIIAILDQAHTSQARELSASIGVSLQARIKTLNDEREGNRMQTLEIPRMMRDVTGLFKSFFHVERGIKRVNHPKPPPPPPSESSSKPRNKRRKLPNCFGAPEPKPSTSQGVVSRIGNILCGTAKPEVKEPHESGRTRTYLTRDGQLAGISIAYQAQSFSRSLRENDSAIKLELCIGTDIIYLGHVVPCPLAAAAKAQGRDTRQFERGTISELLGKTTYELVKYCRAAQSPPDLFELRATRGQNSIVSKNTQWGYDEDEEDGDDSDDDYGDDDDDGDDDSDDDDDDDEWKATDTFDLSKDAIESETFRQSAELRRHFHGKDFGTALIVDQLYDSDDREVLDEHGHKMFVIDVGGAHLEESPQTLKEAGHIISTKIQKKKKASTAKKRARAEGAGAGGLGATGKRKATATEKGKAKETCLPEKDKGKRKLKKAREVDEATDVEEMDFEEVDVDEDEDEALQRALSRSKYDTRYGASSSGAAKEAPLTQALRKRQKGDHVKIPRAKIYKTLEELKNTQGFKVTGAGSVSGVISEISENSNGETLYSVTIPGTIDGEEGQCEHDLWLDEEDFE